MNGMSVKNFCNETLSKTNFPLGRIKVHLIFILSYLMPISLRAKRKMSTCDNNNNDNESIILGIIPILILIIVITMVLIPDYLERWTLARLREAPNCPKSAVCLIPVCRWLHKASNNVYSGDSGLSKLVGGKNRDFAQMNIY